VSNVKVGYMKVGNMKVGYVKVSNMVMNWCFREYDGLYHLTRH